MPISLLYAVKNLDGQQHDYVISVVHIHNIIIIYPCESEH